MYTIEYFNGNEWRFIESIVAVDHIAGRRASYILWEVGCSEEDLRIKDLDGKIIC